MDVVRSLGGDVWNVALDDGGTILPDRGEWQPEFLHGILPLDVNYIYLPGQSIGDAELKAVIALPNLDGLNISNSTITDAGLRSLHSCNRIRELQLYGVTTVSEDAITEFRSAFPNCDVQR